MQSGILMVYPYSVKKAQKLAVRLVNKLPKNYVYADVAHSKKQAFSIAKGSYKKYSPVVFKNKKGEVYRYGIGTKPVI